MNPQDLENTIKSHHAIQRSLCIEGSPGCGKTEIVRQCAKKLGIPIIERHLPTMLVEDFGILFPNGDDTLKYRLPNWFPRADRDGEEGILLFDDRNQGGSDLQKVLANIIQARTLHGHALPPKWSVMSTGNRQSDRAGSNKVLSHLRNRETVVTLDVSLDNWIEWALKNGVSPVLTAFMGFRPNLLNNFDPAPDVKQNATPRSWVEGVNAPLLNFTLPDHVMHEVYSGAVGEGPASEFVAFQQICRDLPDITSVLESPETAVVPSENSVLYAMVGSLAANVTEELMAGLLAYVRRLPAEFNVLTVRTVINNPDKEKWLTESPDFSQWLTDYGKYLSK